MPAQFRAGIRAFAVVNMAGKLFPVPGSGNGISLASARTRTRPRGAAPHGVELVHSCRIIGNQVHTGTTMR